MPHSQRSIPNVRKLWLVLALGAALWSQACRDTTEPAPLQEPSEPPRPPAPITVQATPIGKAILPQADVFVRSDNANKNFGGDDTLLIQKAARKSDVTRILIAFPQPAIAESLGPDSLVSATLEFTIKRTGVDWGTTGRPVALHRMTRTWVEGGATWNCANDLNPANNKTDCNGNTWSMIASPLPYDATPVAQSLITNGQAGVVGLDVTSDVRAFLAGQSANQGWLLKLLNESQTGTVVFHSKEGASKPRLVLSVLKRNLVPPEAPDTIPAWVYQPENFDSNTASITAPFVKSVVMVEFEAGTPVTGRQAAIDSVGGTVIGGRRYESGEGLYYVSVQDTAQGGGLLSAIDKLKTLPQVAFATFDFLDEAAWRVAADGPGWNAWHLNRDTLTGRNWGLEAVLGPMAWGCETGSTETRVAVVDGFGSVPKPADLSNLTIHRPPGIPPAGPNTHGIHVSSVLGATGNNGSGMTGMMWASKIDGYDMAGMTILQTIDRIRDAARSGASVINLSRQARRDASDSMQQAMGDRLASTLRNLRNGTPSYTPLLVIAAGNYNADARVSGYTRAKRSPDSTHILVVAATAPGDTLWRDNAQNASNYGSLVDIAAPGADLGVLNPNGSVGLNSGTSFAAPLVSGIAGLGLSFDSRMSGEDLRRIVLAAADTGGLRVTGADRPYPIAHAYWALKLAASRPGAPLCGNRLWSDGTHVQARRTGGYEPIFQFNEPEYGIMELAAHHGGRRIDFFNSQNAQKRAITLNGQTWSENPGVLGDSGSVSGVWRSLYGYSHDGVQEVFPDITTFNEGAGPLVLKRWDGSSIVPVPGSVTISPPLQQPDTGCAWKLGGGPNGYSCAFLLTGVDENAYTVYTFSPIGDRAIAGYSVWKTTTTVNGDFSPCPWSQPNPETGDPSDLCAESITVVSEPVRAAAYTFPLAGGGVTPLFSLTGSVIGAMEMTEDGSQVIVQEGMEVRKSTGRPGGCGESNPTGWCNGDPEQVTPVGCQITYRSSVTGQPMPPNILTHQACINWAIGSAAASVGSIGRAPVKVPSFIKVRPRPPSH